jgi:amino acid transporter
VAGPGGAVLAYIVMGTVVSSVVSCLLEMTALLPLNSPVVELPRRFLDRGVGFAIGYIYW